MVCVWRGGLRDRNRGEKFPGHAGIMIMLDMCKCHFGSVQSGGVQRSECVFWCFSSIYTTYCGGTVMHTLTLLVAVSAVCTRKFKTSR